MSSTRSTRDLKTATDIKIVILHFSSRLLFDPPHINHPSIIHQSSNVKHCINKGSRADRYNSLYLTVIQILRSTFIMRTNYHRRHANGRIILPLRLLLVVAVASFFCCDSFLPQRYVRNSSFEGNVSFALAFCDKNLAVRYSRHFRSTGQTVREMPDNYGLNSYGNQRTTLSTTREIFKLDMAPLALMEGSEESSLLFWITAFSFSHIGMSAIRQTLITDVFGKFLANDLLGIVGTGKLRLPDFWPGDSSGTNELFPDIETTGRQFYRIFYTMVSFLTLGTSFSIYLGLRGSSEDSILPMAHDMNFDLTDMIQGSGVDGGTELTIILSYAVATLSGAFSLASLVNASPLGLMPSFRQKEEDDSDFSSARVSSVNRAMTAPQTAGDTLLGITRDDSLKFDPKGLTRITRHPLILPVFPWGIATSVLAGGQTFDSILFCGLSFYSIAGCYCQDLRVLRQEGSVGTTFFASNDDDGTAAQSETTIDEKLRVFYDETSFLPFQALLDGRQTWAAMAQEFPILPFLIAIPSAFAIETAFLRFLGVEYNMII